MKDPNDLTPRLRDWMREPVSLREDGVDLVAELVHDTPQQHGWLPPVPAGRRGRALTFAGGVAAGVAVVVLAGLMLVLMTGPDPLPAPAAPSHSPSPTNGPPSWRGVTFEPVVDGCSSGCSPVDRVWAVESGHAADVGSVQAIAFGPDREPWFLGDGIVWRLDEPAEHKIGAVLGNGLAVADDGRVWVASDNGLHSFDGEAWTEPFIGTSLEHVDIAPDGTIIALGGGWTRGTEGSPVVMLGPDGSVNLDSVDVLPEGVWLTDIAAAPEGQLWVSAIASGYWPMAEGQSLIAYTDGEDWTIDRSLGQDVAVAGGGFSKAPDGSVWATLSTLPDEGDWGTYLARHDGRSWTLLETEGVDVPYWTNPSVGPDGTLWFPGSDVTDNVPGGVVALDEQGWTRYLAGEEIATMAVSPDGTALVVTLSSFDDDGRLFAIRR